MRKTKLSPLKKASVLKLKKTPIYPPIILKRAGGDVKDKDVTFNKNARALRLKKILTPKFPVNVVKIRQILSDVKRQ